MIKIFVSLLPFTFTRSTDFDYVRALSLCSNDLNVEFVYPKNKFWGWKENLKVIINNIFSLLHVSCKFAVHFNQKILNREYKSELFDIIYAQEICPENTNGKPVFLENTFMRSGDNSEPNTFMEKWFVNRALPLMKENLSKNCIINLKSEREIENALYFFPNAKDRFVNLPFLLPNLNAVTKEIVENKFKNIETLKFLFVGGEAKRKGLEELLLAYRRLRKKYPKKKIQLDIVSGFNDGNIKLPSDPSIIFHGKLPLAKTRQLFEQSHSFVMVSHRESYGLVYIEAMAKGCIVITRDYYPQKEIIDYGRCGLFAKPYDVDSICQSMEHVLCMNMNQRLQLALRSLEKYESTYDYRVVVEKYRKLFVSMCNES